MKNPLISPKQCVKYPQANGEYIWVHYPLICSNPDCPWHDRSASDER